MNEISEEGGLAWLELGTCPLNKKIYGEQEKKKWKNENGKSQVIQKGPI